MIKKVKYLRVCTTALLIFFPIINNVSDFAVQGVEVKADSKDELKAPTVKGVFYKKVAISNLEHKTVEPFSHALGSFGFRATYVGKDGKTHYIYTDDVKLKVEDQNGKEVLLDKSGNIPIDKLGDYKITYTFVNPDDTSKKTEKIVEFTVNNIASGPVNVGDEPNNKPKIIHTDGSMVEIDPLADIEFNYNYITPTGPEMIRAEPEDISITVVKVAKGGDVPIHLDDNGKFKAGLGTYVVGYKVRNKIDNFQGEIVGRTFIVTDKDDLSNVKDESGIITINYVPGYGVNLWKNHNVEDGTEKLADGTDRKLMTGSAWKYDQVAEDVYGNIWYRLGTNQWVQGDYVNKTPIDPSNSWKITDVEGVGTVNYVPGYGVNLWTSPDQTTFTKKLAHGTAWKYFKIAKKDGKEMYNLGGNQWVDGQYFK